MKRISFLFVVIALAAMPILMAAPSEHEESNEVRLAETKVEARLASIEKRIRAVQDNQAKLNAKQSEILSELETLGVWIRRR